MKAGALDQFLDDVDPWLIAKAMTMNATVVTHEQLNLAVCRKFLIGSGHSGSTSEPELWPEPDIRQGVEMRTVNRWNWGERRALSLPAPYS